MTNYSRKQWCLGMYNNISTSTVLASEFKGSRVKKSLSNPVWNGHQYFEVTAF